MRIRKNGKVVRLTESDLQRIVKRKLNEEDVVDLPEECSDAEIKKIITAVSQETDYKIKIQTGSDYGITGSSRKKLLVITNPNGEECICTKEKFFEGGI